MDSKSSTSELVRTVLQCYPASYRSDSCELFPCGRGFSGAIVCRVETPLGLFCLRGWPPQSYPVERILGLHSLLGYVFREGVTQVSVPLESLAGETLVEQHSRLWQLEPWMPGIANFHDYPSQLELKKNKLKSAMRCLANFHTATKTFQPTEKQHAWFFVKETGYSATVRERLQFLKSCDNDSEDSLSNLSPENTPVELKQLLWKVVSSFRRMRPEIENNLTLCSNERYPLQPCLKDIWHDHVLFTKDEVTGLVDASACRSDSIATDLSRLLGSFCGIDRQLWDVAFKEYETHRHLSIEEKILVEVLDRSGVLLSGMNWVEKFRRNESDRKDFPRIAKRLKLIVQCLESFA